MNRYKNNDDHFAASGSSNLTNSSNYSPNISDFVDQVHSVNALHILTACGQIFLGTAVVLISLLGLIEPGWLSTGMCMVASVVTMFGLYFLYTITILQRDPNRLLRDAMRRIMEAQN